MKYIVVIGDGMADFPHPLLGGKTPLEASDIPAMDYMAQNGVLGRVQTVPAAFTAGSDTANLSILGYAPEIYYSGRGGLEAQGMGICLDREDVVYRFQVVELSERESFPNKTILGIKKFDEKCYDNMTALLNQKLETGRIRFYSGAQGSGLMVWKGGEEERVPMPYQAIGKTAGDFLSGDSSLLDIMQKSCAFFTELLTDMVQKKENYGLWLWGCGKKTVLPLFEECFQKTVALITAVNLMRGIGKAAGIEIVEVEGATGLFNTNYEGKTDEALKALKRGKDIVVIHLEGPDMASHERNVYRKKEAIESIDRRLLRPLLQAVDGWGEPYSVLLLSDHFTSSLDGLHYGGKVPFVLYRSRSGSANHFVAFTEKEAEKGIILESGMELMPFLLREDR